MKDGASGTKCTNSKNGWIDIDLFAHYIQQATPTDLRWAQDTISTLCLLDVCQETENAK